MPTVNETQTRSIVKTVVWRILATLITWVVLYYYTGNVGESFKLTLIAAILSMVAYYLHERVWNIINWGKR